MDGNTKKFKIPSSLIIIKNIISWTIIFILAIIATFLMYYIIRTKFSNIKGQAYEPSFSMYTIISPSMVPNINVYDVIVSKKVNDINTIKIGDIITFISKSNLSSGMTITHRVIDIIEDDGMIKLKTQGDNNLSPDPSYVNKDNLIGKVVIRIPKIGRLQRFILGSGGWLLFIVIPGLLLVFFDVKKLFKLKQTQNKLKPKEPINDIVNTDVLRQEITNRAKERISNQEEEPVTKKAEIVFTINNDISNQEINSLPPNNKTNEEDASRSGDNFSDKNNN